MQGHLRRPGTARLHHLEGDVSLYTVQKILGFSQSVDSLERMNRKMAQPVVDYWDSLETPPASEEGALMVVSADVYRPAAIKQLQTLAEEVGVSFFPSEDTQQPVDIVEAALAQARIKFCDVLLVDTAGRLAID